MFANGSKRNEQFPQRTFQMIPTTFRSIWPSCFRVEDFQMAGHIFGREPSNDYFIKIQFLLSKWFQTRRFLWKFPIGSYVKLSSAVVAILVGVLKCRTQFWLRLAQQLQRRRLKSSSLYLYSSNLGTFWLKIEQFWPFEEISIFSNGGYLGSGQH